MQKTTTFNMVYVRPRSCVCNVFICTIQNGVLSIKVGRELTELVMISLM